MKRLKIIILEYPLALEPSSEEEMRERGGRSGKMREGDGESRRRGERESRSVFFVAFF